MISLTSYYHASLAVECLWLLAYLKDPSAIQTAFIILQENTAFLERYLPASSASIELMHQSFARLIYYHCSHNHLFKPAEIRAMLSQSVALFPSNTIFLSLFAWNESRFRMHDRLRSVLNTVIFHSKSQKKLPDELQLENVIPHFFAVFSEFHRSESLGSNSNTIRATMERAVASKAGAHCPGLWKTYFLLEIERHRDSRSAKTVFYRAIAACPWVKELYLLPFVYLRRTGNSDVKKRNRDQAEGWMSEVELKGVYDLMQRKELRLHVDLDEMIEQMEEATCS